MKKLLIIIILAIASLSVVNDTYSNPNTEMSSGTSFCDGWRDGYIEGYCYEERSCPKPLVPVCPNPRNGENTYQGGYNRGFMKGVADRN